VLPFLTSTTIPQQWVGSPEEKVPVASGTPEVLVCRSAQYVENLLQNMRVCAMGFKAQFLAQSIRESVTWFKGKNEGDVR